jgi:hypothetical protein
MSSSQGRAGSGQQYGPGYQQAGYQQGGHQETGYQQGYQQAGYGPREREGGAGAFAGRLLAGVLMITSGAIAFLSGLAMVIRRTFFVYSATYPYHWTRTGWGWLELILGAVVFAAGFCVILGMTWARIVGIVLATFSAVTAFLTIPLFPVWGIILVAFNAFIIWALASRWREHADY